MTRFMRVGFVLALLAGALTFTATPASAYTASCFSDFVTNGTPEVRADWNGDGHTDQCFAIKSDRTIWNVWRGGPGWREMPNNGIADKACFATIELATGYHKIYVYTNGRGAYSSRYNNATRRWEAWQYAGTGC